MADNMLETIVPETADDLLVEINITVLAMTRCNAYAL